MSQDVATKRGRFTVETKETSFGPRLVHGLDGMIAYVVLPSGCGWKPVAREVKMGHQTYRKHVPEILEDYPRARELAVADLDSGEWVTVWVKDGREPSSPLEGEPETESERRVALVDEIVRQERAEAEGQDLVWRLFDQPKDALADAEGGEYVSTLDLLDVIEAHQEGGL